MKIITVSYRDFRKCKYLKENFKSCFSTFSCETNHLGVPCHYLLRPSNTALTTLHL
jgi:hypothetical protein